MEILILIFVIALPVLKFVFEYNQYESSNYKQETNNSFLSVYFNKGLNGEYHLSQYLSSFQSIGCKCLFNVYIPRNNGKTSEIDVILFHPKGLFVIESKNYSGWIFGNEKNKYWTQVLPVRRWKSHKERFYNPIMQNATHIRAVRKHIDDTIPVYSVIAFSDECTFKDVTVKSNVVVTHYSRLYKSINNIISNSNYLIPPELLNRTYENLSQFSNVDYSTKIQHIYNIKWPCIMPAVYLYFLHILWILVF